ncbi:double-strand break repair protein AddB [Pseudooceanicola onchidii]|uniref:double-strand break repair protein AddB n=1 Tax=Pseudooceanicola onchidii TaxID=2562279 RepID=UPI0010AA7FE1|nr:double-strand break repair protein AddB [Pseudooceanicola onchidii]
MFDPSDKARVFGLPPGADFPRLLVEGLIARTSHLPPEALGRVTLIVNTRRMARRIRSLFDEGPARLLPRVQLVTDIGETFALGTIPAPVSPLRRRLGLVQLVSALLEQEPDLAPRAALYDLADSLAQVFEEMRGEGISFDDIRTLDVSQHSDHWARALKFLTIVDQVEEEEAPDPAARLRLVAEMLAKDWPLSPPPGPVILAGSTGSRGATNVLMQAVARLPQGAVVLPGYDFDLPDAVWTSALDDPLTGEDHPQFRFRKLAVSLDLGPRDIGRWHMSRQNDARNRLVSLAMRPAPVTDQWLSEGPALRELDQAFDGVTLLEAPSAREEAQAIALRLRQAAEEGQRAALITPDRLLSRQVKAALSRWDILPDDSAGEALHLTPPGRFIRQVAALWQRRVGAAGILALLKHPLCHSGADRADHLRYCRAFELQLRRHGPPFPDAQTLFAFAETYAKMMNEPQVMAWAAWAAPLLASGPDEDPRPLGDRLDLLIDRAGQLAAGTGTDGSGGLWQGNAGEDVRGKLQELQDAADVAGAIGPDDFTNLLTAILRGAEERDSTTPHPDILIWGTLEARVQGADLVILGGLNEGSWPEAPSPDPWLNRQMRAAVGLLLPERRIGLSAHDFQQAIAAPEVWVTRALRGSEAETVASRWLNRITNLLNGLGEPGQTALAGARTRGRHWLGLVRTLEAVTPVPPAPRPAPRPPAHARLRDLSVTQVKTLIRDPYAIYARKILDLKPLDPLMKAPDALLRGIIAHEVMERFVKDVVDDPAMLTPARLTALTEEVLAREVPWAEARILWLARMARSAEDIIAGEITRQGLARPAVYEVPGEIVLDQHDFKLTARADRVDLDANGNALIYDYKTGAMSSPDQQKSFDLQLLLQAAMAERWAFRDLDPRHVVRAAFIGIGSVTKEVEAPLWDISADDVWARFSTLIQRYSDPAQPFTSRRAMFKTAMEGDYDHLARLGEWDVSQDATPEDVG